MVPIRNVYHLLCYAWSHLDAAPLADVGELETDCIEDLLAHVLVTGTAGLLKRGLDRAYVPYAEDVRGVRGKLELASTLKRLLDRSGRAVCAFDELSPDVLHNRLLRATMLRLATATSAPRLACDLRRLASAMHHVSDVVPKPASFGRVQLHRNNKPYVFLMHVCELVCRSLVPDERGTGYRFVDFRRDEQEMGALFEAFLREFLRAEQDSFAVRGEHIPWAATAVTEGSSALLPLMRTDISLVAPGRKIVLEAKFYAEPLRTGRDGKKKLRESHLYQVLAYLENLRVHGVQPADTAILLYAAAGMGFVHRFRVAGHEIQARTLDLSQPWPGIRRDLLQLVHELASTPLVAPAPGA